MQLHIMMLFWILPIVATILQLFMYGISFTNLTSVGMCVLLYVFDLLDILLSKDDDVLFVIDELERSLHPMLTRRFLELFNERRDTQRTQLLFTTHEDAIMCQELLRRDEIWFVERNAANNSVIYSLDRFKQRYDKKLAKAYMEGRYGAIPVFSSLEDFLK